MFGHDNQNDQNQPDNSGAPVISPAPDELLQDVQATAATTSGPSFDTSNISLGSPSPAPAASSDNNVVSDTDDILTSTAPTPAPANPTTPTPVMPGDEDHLLTTGDNDDLIRIKQDALQQLSPLVDHLEQTPEEKFRTTMMMIQASDDQSLIQTAYNAAKDIKDDKVRAQALLDIINEINYFTQQAAK